MGESGGSPGTSTQGKGGEGVGGRLPGGTRSGQGCAGTSREGTFPWFPTWAFLWENDSTPPPPQARPRGPWGPQGQTGCLHPTDRRGRRDRGGLPPALGSILKTSERPFHRGSRPGGEGGWGRRGGAGVGAPREGSRKPQQAHLGPEAPTAACPCCRPTRPAGSPGPAGERESWRGPALPVGTASACSEGPGF